MYYLILYYHIVYYFQVGSSLYPVRLKFFKHNILSKKVGGIEVYIIYEWCHCSISGYLLLDCTTTDYIK